MSKLILRSLLALSVAQLVSSAAVAQNWSQWQPATQLPLPRVTSLPVVHVPAIVPQLPTGRVSAVAPAPTAAAASATATQYQVEYRHPTETSNEWRVAVGWTTNYSYARNVYTNLVDRKVYDVRLYKRGGK